MIAVDTNVLVYAHRRETAEFGVARETVRRLAEGTERWAIAWPCIYEFFGVVTNRKIWKDKASDQCQAWDQVRAWISSPALTLLSEPADFTDVLQPLVCRDRVRGPVVHDARIAALCLAHGVDALISRDRDFSLFPELRLVDPFG